MARKECLSPGCTSRAVHRHHVCYRQHVRRAGGDVDDERNLVPLCFTCHELHHSGAARLPMWVLPDSVFEFASEVLGREAAYEYLARRYRSGDSRHTALLDDVA